MHCFHRLVGKLCQARKTATCRSFSCSVADLDAMDTQTERDPFVCVKNHPELSVVRPERLVKVLFKVDCRKDARVVSCILILYENILRRKIHSVTFLCLTVDLLSSLNACGVDMCCLSSPFVCCTEYQRCGDDPEHFVKMMNMYSSRKGRPRSDVPRGLKNESILRAAPSCIRQLSRWIL